MKTERIRKGIVVILLAGLLGAALSGCSAGGSTAAQTPASAETSETQTPAETAEAASETETETAAPDAAGAADAAAELNEAEDRVADAAADTVEETDAAAPASYAVIEPASASLGIILEDAMDEDRTEYRETLLKELAAVGFDRDRMTVLDSDEGGVSAAVSRLLADDVDLLIVETGEDDLGQEATDKQVEAIADEAAAAFTPVVFIGRAPGEKETLRWIVRGYETVYVGSGYAGRGRDQAALIVSLGRENRDLDNNAVLRYVYVSEGTDVNKADRAAMAEALRKKGITGDCVAELTDKDGWENQLTDLLHTHGKSLDMIVCSEDDIAEDVPEIARGADRKPGRNLVIIGAGAEEDVLDQIIAGEVTGTVYRDVLTECRTVAGTAVRLCAREIPENGIINGVSVTAANAQEIRDYRESFLKTDM